MSALGLGVTPWSVCRTGIGRGGVYAAATGDGDVDGSRGEELGRETSGPLSASTLRSSAEENDGKIRLS